MVGIDSYAFSSVGSKHLGASCVIEGLFSLIAAGWQGSSRKGDSGLVSVI